jgi:hypothetical protein
MNTTVVSAKCKSRFCRESPYYFNGRYKSMSSMFAQDGREAGPATGCYSEPVRAKEESETFIVTVVVMIRVSFTLEYPLLSEIHITEEGLPLSVLPFVQQLCARCGTEIWRMERWKTGGLESMQM